MMRSLRSVVGATLLEVMLVLSIVALIILMSVRYYQATNTSSQTQQLMSLIQAITASSDNLALGSATGYSNATTTNVTALAGSNALISPGGGTASISAQTSTTYTVSIPAVTNGACTVVKAKLASNPKYTTFSCPATNGAMTYIYDSTK